MLVLIFQLCMQTVSTYIYISCYDDGTEIAIAMHKLQNTCYTETHVTLQSWLLYLEYIVSALVLECQEERIATYVYTTTSST